MPSDESFTVGDWLVEPDLDRISRESESTSLRPQVMELLVYLARRQGRVAKTEDLLNDLWPGKVVTDGTVYNCVAELRHALDEGEDGQTCIETIPKKGYRLLLPVTGLEEAHDRVESRREKTWLRSTTGIAAVIILLFGIAGVLAWMMRSDGIGDGEPVSGDEFSPMANSVAVLPFEDLTPDKNNEYLADGIAEILIHQLSQVKDLQVIARQSAFAFKGKNTDVRDIGRILNVESVLQGSVQRADGKLRIAAQLIDTQSGTHIWSKLFDRDDAGIFAIQDEIAYAVASEISGTIWADGGQIGAAAPIANLDAYELYLLGRHRSKGDWFTGLKGAHAKEAVNFFLQAIDRDPDFALAYSGLADVLVYAVLYGYAGFAPEESMARAKWATDQALALNPELAEAHVSRGLIESLEKDFENAGLSFERAAELNPSYLAGYPWPRGMFHAFTRLGQAEQLLSRGEALDPLNESLRQNTAMLAVYKRDFDKAIAAAHETYRLAKTDVGVARALRTFAITEWAQGHNDKAIAYAELATQIDSDESGLSSLDLAASYFILGDYGSARHWLDQISATEAKFAVQTFLYLFYFGIRDTARLEAHIQDVIEPVALQQNHPMRTSYEPHAIIANGLLGNCARVIELGNDMEMTERNRNRIWADMWLAYCHRQHGNLEYANDKLDYISQWGQELIDGPLENLRSMHDLAVVKALEGDRDGALSYLKRAYELGYRNYRFIEMDPFFADYRDDERYMQVVTAMRQEVDEMKQRLLQAKINDDWYSLTDVEPKDWMQ